MKRLVITVFITDFRKKKKTIIKKNDKFDLFYDVFGAAIKADMKNMQYKLYIMFYYNYK